jgi:uncharacterized protein YoxC
MMMSKYVGLAGVVLTVVAMVVSAAMAHASVSERVDGAAHRIDGLERRLDGLESKVDDVLWNMARLCQASGVDGCRSGL